MRRGGGGSARGSSRRASAGGGKGRADITELDVGVGDGGVGFADLNVGGDTGSGGARATSDTGAAGVGGGGVVGVEPEHFTAWSSQTERTRTIPVAKPLEIPSRAPCPGRRWSRRSSLLVKAELVSDGSCRADDIPGTLDVGVLDDHPDLHVEAADLLERSGGGSIVGKGIE